ncbi:MAG: helix-turn-helix domain-containing protein [Bacteroidales bacterium]|nr:helix-turn-helix domain-containing protein [Bacteroidales bacterium]
MNYHFGKPSYPLSLFVKQYWAIDNCMPNDQEHIQRIIPNGLMELMFYLGNRPRSLNDNKPIPEDSILSGQQKAFYDIAVSGELSMFSISFKPFGAKMFFDIPSNECFDQNLPLKYLVPVSVSELESDLYESASFEGKIVVAESFLLNQLRKNYDEYGMNRISHSIGIINQAKGVVSIDELSSGSCLSRKQYERTFSTYIGSSPKQFLRTIRFQNTLLEKHRNKNIPLTELAYHCGYFDQSHMINDYKQISGLTPSQYFAECEPCSDYFM